MQTVSDTLSLYPESKVYTSTPAVIPGLGSSGGIEMALEARGDCTYEQLQAAADSLVYYASQRKEFASISSAMQKDIPQLYFDVDRDKAQLLGSAYRRHLLYAEGLHRLGLCQRLQHVQPHLQGLPAGGGPLQGA